MSKIISMLMLLALSSDVIAEWVKVADVMLGKGASYVDATTIRRSGDTAAMWSLTDIATEEVIDGRPYLSQKSRYEYDCKDNHVRSTAISRYAGNMGMGNLIASDDHVGKWISVAPYSLFEYSLKIACGKK